MATPQQAQQAADQHADRLSAYPNVVGVGTRAVDRDAGPTGAEHAVAVYVDRKVPTDQLRERERLPAAVDLATTGGTARVPVVVVEIGAVEPEDADGGGAPDGPFTSD